MLSTHLRLGLPSGPFPSGFPTKTLYTPLYSTIRATLWQTLLNLYLQLVKKVNLSLPITRTRTEGEDVCLHSFLTSVLDGDE